MVWLPYDAGLSAAAETVVGILKRVIVRTERQSARMSKIKYCGLDQYGAEPSEQQQFGTAGIEGVNKCF